MEEQKKDIQIIHSWTQKNKLLFYFKKLQQPWLNEAGALLENECPDPK